MPRKEALSLEEVIPQFLRRMKLASGVNTQRVFAAWDAVSGASAYTLGRFYRGGRLYVTLSSSMVRGQLDLRKADLVAAINDYLASAKKNIVLAEEIMLSPYFTKVFENIREN